MMIVLDKAERQEYRRLARAPGRKVVVVKGAAPPTLLANVRMMGVGRRPYFLAPALAVHQNEDIKCFGKRTYRVEVGAQWVWQDRLRRRVGLTEDAPEYAILDRAREMGLVTDS